MRWLSSLFTRAAIKAADAVDRGLTLVPRFFSQAAWQFSSDYPTLAEKAFGGNAIVFATMRLLCSAVAEPPLQAATEAADGTLDPLPKTHPLARLLDRPNELMTGYEMVELIELHAGLAGASYWWKQRTNGGAVESLWPLRPDRILPAYQPNMSAPAGERLLRGWWYAPPGGGTPVLIPRSDVLAFGYPNPSGETGGIVESIGWVMVLANDIAADSEATSFVGALLANYAQPSMLIKTKMPIRDIEIARRLKAQFMTELGGSHRGEPALLDADTEIEKLSFDLKQLEFPSLRAQSESRVAAAAGVPAILIGLKVGLDASTYSNFESAREFFTETTLAAKWKRYGDQITNDLAAEYGPGLVVRFDTSAVKALSGQRLRHAEPIKAAFAEGVILVDEYREQALGLGPLPNGAGRVLLVPNNVTVTRPEDLLAEPEPPMLPPGQPPNALPPPADDTDDEEDEPPRARKSAAVRALADDVQAMADATKARHAATLQADLAVWLDGVREHVIARFGETAKAWPDADELVPDEDWIRLGELLKSGWALVLGDAIADVNQTMGLTLSFDLENQWVKDVIAAVGVRERGIKETIQTNVQAAILKGAQEGLSVPQVADLLRALPGLAAGKAETIALTESAVAYNLGSLHGYDESGLVSEVEVLDGRDFDAECKAIHGQKKSLHWARTNPIQHPRCRRAFAPIVNV